MIWINIDLYYSEPNSGHVCTILDGLAVTKGSDLTTKQVRDVDLWVSALDATVSVPAIPILVSNVFIYQNDPSSVADILYPTGKLIHNVKYLPRCRQLAISQFHLLEPSFWEREKCPSSLLTKGIVVDLVYFFSLFPKKMHLMSQAVCSLFQVASCEPSDLWTKANRIYLASSKHRRAHLAKILAERFEVPVPSGLQAPAGQVPGLVQHEVRQLVTLVSEDPSSLPDVTTPKCTNTSSPDLSLKGPSSSSSTLVKLHTHREHLRSVTKKLRATTAARVQRVRQQLAVVRRCRRHFSKQAESRLTEVQSLKLQVDDLRLQLADERESRKETERRVQQADKSKHNLESKVCYYRKKQVTLPSLSQSKILQLQVSFWQTRCTELEKEVERFLREDDVKTFHGGCYSDVVKEVYLDLMCLRFGSRNVERIIRLVLKKMTGTSTCGMSLRVSSSLIPELANHGYGAP